LLPLRIRSGDHEQATADIKGKRQKKSAQQAVAQAFSFGVCEQK
jgi:hypothetical protein